MCTVCLLEPTYIDDMFAYLLTPLRFFSVYLWLFRFLNSIFSTFILFNRQESLRLRRGPSR